LVDGGFQKIRVALSRAILIPILNNYSPQLLLVLKSIDHLLYQPRVKTPVLVLKYKQLSTEDLEVM